jgi:hypothetical protein
MVVSIKYFMASSMEMLEIGETEGLVCSGA